MKRFVVSIANEDGRVEMALSSYTPLLALFESKMEIDSEYFEGETEISIFEVGEEFNLSKQCPFKNGTLVKTI